jgi:hypothetical protein
MKCAVCGMDVDKNPCLTTDGKCNLCDKKLTEEKTTK